MEEILASIEQYNLIFAAELELFGLTPCEPFACTLQTSLLIIPDSLLLDLTQPSGYPNGRTLTDPVVDLTLSIILLDLSVHDPYILVGLNPVANDVAFQPSFPYLAPPH